MVGPIPVKPIQTVTPPAKVDARYEPARMTIRNRAAEMDTDWTPVWDERGAKKPYSLLRECNERTQRHYAEDLVAQVRDGDRIGDLRNKGQGIFGDVAFARYMRQNHVEVTMVAAPKYGLHFDVRVHPPEINVETKVLD